MITDSENNAYREETKDEYVLSLGELLGVVWKRFWIILLVTIVFMGMAAGFSFIEEPEYQASIKILVGQESEDSEEASALGGAVQGLQDVTLTMAEAVETRSVAEEVIERLDLQMPPGDFLTQLDSEPVPNTQFIEVTYTDGNPEEASRVANTIGEVFSERVSDISPNAVTATVWDSAPVPEYAVNLTPLRDILLAMVVGAMLGVALAFVLEYLDDSWHSPEEAEQVSGVPTFGVIPAFSASSRKSREASSGGWLDDEEDYLSDGEESQEDPVKAVYQQVALAAGSAWSFGIALIDGEGKIEKATPAFRDMLGFDDEEFVGEDFANFASHPDDAEANAGLHEELASGERDDYQLEKRYVRKDGQLMWARLTVSPVRDPDGTLRFAVGMIENITKEKQVEKELVLSREAQRISEGRLRAVVDQSPLLVHSFTPDGSPLLSNAAWEEFWGGGQEEESLNVFENRRLREAGLSGYIEESVAGEEPVSTPVLRYEAGAADNGSFAGARWIRAYVHPVRDESGRMLEVMLAVEDVTDRQQAEEAVKENAAERRRIEEALRESQERFRSLVRFATDDSDNGDERWEA